MPVVPVCRLGKPHLLMTAVAQTAPVAKPYLGRVGRGRGVIAVGERRRRRRPQTTHTAISLGLRLMNPKNTSDAMVVIPEEEAASGGQRENEDGVPREDENGGRVELSSPRRATHRRC